MRAILVVAVMALLAEAQYKRVLLSSVQALTLEDGKMTTGRRTSPIPQLRCVGQCHLAKVTTAHCKNVGSDGLDAQWQCTTPLPAGLSLGRIEVVCEGFEYPEDPYVTAGSCGLEYSLSSTTPYRAQYVASTASSGGGWLTLLVVAAVAYVVWRTCAGRMAANAAAAPPPPVRRRPPPPYRPEDDNNNNRGGGYGYDKYYEEPFMPPDAGMMGGMGGFMGGLGMGALGGYMMGRRNYGYGYEGRRPRAPYQPTIPTGGYSYGGGIGGYTPGPGWAGGGDTPPPPQQQTAHGGTRRR